MSQRYLGNSRSLVFGALALTAAAAQGEAYDCVIEARQTVDIRAAVEGLIDRVLVARGDLVEAGQVVVELDAGRERARVDLARYRASMSGAIRSAESRIEYSEQQLARLERLHAEKYVSEQERDEAATEKRLAEAQLQEATETKRLAELEFRHATEELRLRTLRSPIDGVVVDVLMNAGELADNRDLRKPAMRLAEIGVLHVEALLPVAVYGQVEVGMDVTVIPEAPFGGRHVARVKVADRVLDAASGTFGVRLELPNPELRLPAGIKCRAEFDGLRPAESVPIEAGAPLLGGR